MEESRCRHCIIIPTYNNAQTLKAVIDGVCRHIAKESVIIVNDGSTDQTANILKAYPAIHQIHFKKNIGKGRALRQGFKKAISLGYTHAISLDSDGQHFPEDIPKLRKASTLSPKTLFIGSRNMKQDGVPGKSSFGNRFSNFWFWFETGLKLSDTQSGFRVYPLTLMPKKWFTNKFEFEIESIVRSAWKFIPVKNIPIKIKYENKENRVSHFRPFIDFTRISILNTILVFITILYIIPRNFILNFKKKSFRQFLKEDVLGSQDTPKVKAISLALGVFIGIIPVWGFQTIIVLFLAVSFRLNKLLAFAASNISIPPMIPIIVIASLKIGSFILGRPYQFDDYFKMSNIGHHLLEYLLGSFILAISTATIIGLISYFSLKSFTSKTIK